ncbi:hypothetical protein JHK82_048237 [Glycine max]|nr:hypothetical protein JHK82_048237 [Glycine max]
MMRILKKEAAQQEMMVVEIESTEGRRKSGETKVMRGKAVEITPREADTKVLVRVRGVKVTHELLDQYAIAKFAENFEMILRNVAENAYSLLVLACGKSHFCFDW